ncbi:Pr6Pr family membrane protein [Plantibacter flavus]|uniref:Pr6Pr family membrane protein n=1 Tax=Plantibacter flavus TaxID=150123 RepID=UPI003F1663A4
MNSRTAAILYRLVFAVLSLTAVFVQFFAVTVAGGLSVFNFFCYFTNLSNLMISAVFIISAVRLIVGRTDPSDSDVAIRGGAVVYIVFVGVVFNTILADGDVGAVIPWVNTVVHIIVPIAGLADWIIWAPRRRLPFSVTLWWMIWPVVYSLFSLIRGAIDGFYPYPFYNPERSGGYGGVALWCLALIVGFFVLANVVRWVGNLRHRTLEPAS